MQHFKIISLFKKNCKIQIYVDFIQYVKYVNSKYRPILFS